jgi:hypothetical protein
MCTTVGKIFDASLELFGAQEGWRGRKGAYFCMADPKWGVPIFTIAVGDILDVLIEKSEKYHGLVCEKSRRLACYPGHVSSFQSRDPDNGLWGGAVRGNYIYSMSGLPELGDEAVVAALMYNFQPWSAGVVDEIVKMSNNPYYKPLVEFLLKKT